MDKNLILKQISQIEEMIYQLLDLESQIEEVAKELHKEKTIHASQLPTLSSNWKRFINLFATYRRQYNTVLETIDALFQELFQFSRFVNLIEDDEMLIQFLPQEIVIATPKSTYRLFPKDRYDLTVYDFLM